MRVVRLDGAAMTTVDKVHATLQKEMGFPDYYGNNLDALWDMLSEESEEVHIILEREEAMKKLLGAYVEELIRVFREAETENEYLTFEIRA